MKLACRRVSLVLLLMFTLVIASPILVLAGDLDAIQSGQASLDGSIVTPQGSTSQYSDENAVADYLRGYTAVTGENMATASRVMSPVTRFLGNLAGCIMVFTSGAIFVITAADLAYIGLPFLRGILNPEYAAGGGQAMGGAPMGGGMMGGYGRGGMMGGMGMMGGGMQQGSTPQGGMLEHGLRRKWISDEAALVVNLYAKGGAQAQQAQQGGMMGGGMGMGMGMGMGGMNPAMQQQAQQDVPTKTVILEYFKKRTFFMIIFAVSSVLLMSSLFTDCGINIALLIDKAVTKLNGGIANVEV